MKEPTEEDLDYVHKLILTAERRRLLGDDILEGCVELLNHFGVFHKFLGACKNCDKTEWFWAMKKKLEEIIKDKGVE